MAELSADFLTRVSTNAAEQFADAYYDALHNGRAAIASYYLPKSVLPSGRSLPAITYNGQQLSDPDEFQKIYQDQMPFAFFEVQSLNAHVMNPSMAPLEATGPGKAKPKELESNMSFLLQVSGYVRLFERKDGPMKAFSDTLVLVPNKEEVGAKGKGKTGEGKSYVIQSQNFRFVV